MILKCVIYYVIFDILRDIKMCDILCDIKMCDILRDIKMCDILNV